jgi:CRISPR-associated exonuclease Cas4
MVDERPNGRRSIPISALEHHAYCPRQAALIHVEAYFDASVDTVRGDLAHQAVDRGGTGSDRRRRTVRSLPVWSDVLGLHGVCDVVQFDEHAAPTPIEHKSGRYRRGGPADLQVAAQAICLQEMFGVDVPTGVVFSGRDRRRHDVIVDDFLTARVVDTIHELRRLLDSGDLPAPVHDRRCTRCSLLSGCLPDAPSGPGDLFAPRPLGDWDG